MSREENQTGHRISKKKVVEEENTRCVKLLSKILRSTIVWVPLQNAAMGSAFILLTESFLHFNYSITLDKFYKHYTTVYFFDIIFVHLLSAASVCIVIKHGHRRKSKLVLGTTFFWFYCQIGIANIVSESMIKKDMKSTSWHDDVEYVLHYIMMVFVFIYIYANISFAFRDAYYPQSLYKKRPKIEKYLEAVEKKNMKINDEKMKKRLNQLGFAEKSESSREAP